MRHKLLWCLFLAVVAVCFLLECHTAEGAQVVKKPTTKRILFKSGKTVIPATGGRREQMGKTFASFAAPVLVEANGRVVVVAEAHFMTDSKECVGVVARTMHGNGRWGNVSAILRDAYSRDELPYLLSPTPIVTNGELSVILGGFGRADKQPNGDASGSIPWELRMASGNFVEENEDQKNEKDFIWNEMIQPVNSSFSKHNEAFETQLSRKSLKQISGGGGAGALVDDTTFVLPLQGLRKNGTEVSLTVSFPNTGYNWELSRKTTDEGCTNPAVLNWEEKKSYMITSCESGHYKIYRALNEKGEWEEEPREIFWRAWGTNKRRRGPGFRVGFITAVISEQKVALLTQPVEGENGVNQLHLWVTDMRHIYDVGPISSKNHNVTASSLLYKEGDNHEKDGSVDEGKLYCAYEVNKDENKRDIVFAELTYKLRRIKKILQKWKAVDKVVMQRFGLSTDGLVGHLLRSSNNGSEWQDEYLCVNATVTSSARSVSNGFTFDGAGAGAKWYVSPPGQNHPYHFVNYAFTLVATIVIHEKPSQTLPLLGIALGDEKKMHYGLSYTSNNKWSVLNGSEEELHNDFKWEKNKPYQVALSMNDLEFDVQIDGTYFCADDYCDSTLYIKNPDDIMYFYFGAYNDTVSTNVTIKNVFLYSSLLSKTQLDALRKITSSTAEEAANDITQPLPVTQSAADVPIAQPHPVQPNDTESDLNSHSESVVESVRLTDDEQEQSEAVDDILTFSSDAEIKIENEEVKEFIQTNELPEHAGDTDHLDIQHNFDNTVTTTRGDTTEGRNNINVIGGNGVGGAGQEHVQLGEEDEDDKDNDNEVTLRHDTQKKVRDEQTDAILTEPKNNNFVGPGGAQLTKRNRENEKEENADTGAEKKRTESDLPTNGTKTQRNRKAANITGIFEQIAYNTGSGFGDSTFCGHAHFVVLLLLCEMCFTFTASYCHWATAM